MGIGDWGLGIGDWAQSPIPNPQSPIPNPQSPYYILKYYLGKRVVYVYKTKSGYRTIWGRIRSHHGNNGAVIAKFLHNLPPRAIGATLRVMLYPQRK